MTLTEGKPDYQKGVDVPLRSIFAGKRGILFAVPGAFTPGCSKARRAGEKGWRRLKIGARAPPRRAPRASSPAPREAAWCSVTAPARSRGGTVAPP